MFFRLPILVTTLALFLPIHAAPVRSVDDPSDVFAPGPKTAGAQDAWSIFHNPAGMAFVDGAQLVGGYAYQLRLNQEDLHLGQGGLAVSLVEGLSLGLGLQLALPQVQGGTDKGAIGGSFGLAFRLGRTMSFGARVFKQRQYALAESDPLGFTLGVEFFPFSWLSFGANFNQVHENFASYPEILAGVAVRPFTDKVTLAFESKFWPRSNGVNPEYSFHPELGLRVDLGGVSLLASARANDIGNGFSAPVLFAGIDVNFDHVGLGGVAQGRPSDLLTFGGRFRLSSETWPSLVQKKNKIAAIKLDENGAMANFKLPLARRLFGAPANPVETIWHLSNLAKDPSVSRVVFQFPAFAFRFARAQELRDALLELKASGKEVQVHFDSVNAETYLAASAADHISMSPAGEIEVDDFRNTLIYLHDLLAKLGLDVEAVTAGKFKNAPDMFTKNEPSKEELEVRNRILDHNLQAFSDALSSSTDNGTNSALEIINKGVLDAEEAKRLRLIDDIQYIDDIVDFETFSDLNRRNPYAWSETPRVAVISIKGMIVPGKVTPSLFGGFQRRAGAQDTIEAIDAALNDRHCIAIVLRIDSPGGDALASNLVYHAVKKATQKKPVVASFGDVAASGAYYIGSAANFIVAEPTTLTGSIGVFSLVTSAAKLADKMSLKHFELNRGANPGPSWFRPMSASERQRRQHLVDTEYALFKSNVADSRHFTAEKVEELAQGRVWTGIDAFKFGLVDQQGGFSQALSQAKALAGYDDDTLLSLSFVGEPTASLLSLSLFGNTNSPFETLSPLFSSAPLTLSHFSYDFPSSLKEIL